ncbi:XRE family transcriptional regulator [Cryobacterium sp. Sr8]|uniref:helix-turn-helix transcriptional regulator n=1 Tax=Cryobacterium sp. Sr8 TaxID=1259203 RepID=UPI00106C3A5D|nr:helix-turn-helix transcriptional regulator [Cryobacterium sp. Sr8]TFD74878.1 XRE family transcriptional regulator [Cryobacterium sp. Sr8]
MTDIPRTASTLHEWEEEVGAGIRQLRIDAGYDQVTLAERANISRSAVQSLENGAGSRLRTLIAVLRALDRTDLLGPLLPLHGPSPLEVLAEAQRRSRRQQRHRPKRSD